jgi:MFS family permease
MAFFPKPAGFAVLRHHDFTCLIGARFFGSIAIQMQDVGIAWTVYNLTGRPLDLGLVGLAEFLPAIGLALVTGSVVDRYNRRWIVLISYLIYCLCAVLLLGLGQHRQVWPILAIVILFGTARAFAFPALQALLPNLVPRAELGQAIALSSSSNQLATIGGPALGGLIFAVGPNLVFGVAAVSFAASSILLYAIRLRAVPVERTPVTWANLLAGVKFIRSRQALLGAISLDLFAVLLGGATALLPIYARDILMVGPTGLGVLRSAPAVGAALTALYIASRPLGAGAGRIMLFCVGIFGIATVVFGLSTNFWLSLASLVVLGCTDMSSVFVRSTLVQVATPDGMRGRVSAVNSVFISASNELGQFESGITAAWFGTIPAVVLGGVGTIVVAAVWAAIFPSLRRVDLSASGLEELAAANDEGEAVSKLVAS